MKLLAIIILLTLTQVHAQKITLTQVHAQKSEIKDWVHLIDSLKSSKKLTVKSYPNKTFFGSLKGYFLDNSLVLIVSLKDGEYGGTESLFYLKQNRLQFIEIAQAEFIEHTEWENYYTKHLENENCRNCHSTPNCKRIKITYLENPIIEYPTDSHFKIFNKEEFIHELNQMHLQMVSLLNEI